MLSDLKKAADKSELYEPEDFQRAAGELLARQFLYADHPRQRGHYLLVTRELEYFRKLFEALNWVLRHDPDLLYVGILPRDGEASLRLKHEEALLLLTLRLLYEEALERYDMDQGSAWTDTETWLMRYEVLTRRERPNLSRLREIVALFARHGIVQRGEEDGEARILRLKIRPAVRLVAGDAWLSRLEAFLDGDEAMPEDELLTHDDVEETAL
ncbi:MAG: DUF4194 domain-containing protein [Gammaproteobacteria bacterium]|nr:DUF4194 domain-containing protein [Gammaproteobacteria bacterium]